MDFSRINKISYIKNFLEIKKLSELSLDSDYTVSDIRAVESPYGTRFTIDVDNKFACYLPVRFTKAFEEDKELFQQMAESAVNGSLLMRYHGGQYHSITFKPAQK